MQHIPLNKNLHVKEYVPSEITKRCFNFNRDIQLKNAGLYPFFQALESAQDPEVICNGRRMIMMSSNNYLGLSNHPKVKTAAIKAIRKYGTGCAGSPLLNGRLDIHVSLEEALAEFLQKDAAIIFPTGYQANLGVISALGNQNDLIATDKLNHASIVDGCRLSTSRVRRFKHNNMAHLDQILSQATNHGCVVIADGVFSMEGDIINLPELVVTGHRHNAIIVIDDAHGFGVLGKEGRGTGEHFGLNHEVDLLTITFSKALATVGGAIVGDTPTINFLRHHARPLIFSASLPAPQTAAAMAALGIIKAEPWRKDKLWKNTAYMRRGLRALGITVGESQSPILPVTVGDEEKVLIIWRRLFDKGVFVTPVFSPAVPKGNALIRLSCMSNHTLSHLDQVLEYMFWIFHELDLC